MKRSLVLGIVYVYMVILGLAQVECRRRHEGENSSPRNEKSTWRREETRNHRPRPWAHRPGDVTSWNGEKRESSSPFRNNRRLCNDNEVKFIHSCIPRDQWEYYMLFSTIFFLGLLACIFICVLFIAVKLYNRYMRWKNRKLYGCPVRKSHLPTCTCQCFKENTQVPDNFTINSVENINSYETPCYRNNFNREAAAQPHVTYPNLDYISSSRNDFPRKDEPPQSKYYLLK
jgi:hypothetical protein